MDPETQLMVQALSGGDAPALPSVAPAQSGLSPEAIAALFLVPATNYQRMEPTKLGQSGSYDIHHDKAGKVGEAALYYDPQAKRLTVGDIGVTGNKFTPVPRSSAARAGNEWAQALGTKEIKSLLQNIKETFPDAETIRGYRISGAREVNNPDRKAGFTEMNLGRYKAGGGGGGNIFGAPGQKITDLW